MDEYDCIVSPANSFGIMDGGFDKALIEYFGNSLMERVQNKIKDEYAGEQPVGTCLIVNTGDEKHPYLAHTPTMRIPRIIREYDTVYNAMRAMKNIKILSPFYVLDWVQQQAECHRI